MQIQFSICSVFAPNILFDSVCETQDNWRHRWLWICRPVLSLSAANLLPICTQMVVWDTWRKYKTKNNTNANAIIYMKMYCANVTLHEFCTYISAAWKITNFQRGKFLCVTKTHALRNKKIKSITETLAEPHITKRLVHFHALFCL